MERTVYLTWTGITTTAQQTMQSEAISGMFRADVGA
jgi:hypothetical protein